MLNINIDLEEIRQIIRLNTERNLSLDDLYRSKKFIENSPDLRAEIHRWIVMNSSDIISEDLNNQPTHIEP